ncbi:RING finger protein 141-like [Anopheles nili]|uniref:RING finger protein 141-like n=1 Tax=Anopheles nili TaxID=185578 RepID=UPI00237A6A0A|nr:RING finger protein 141-like [Anopheles nili]
MGSQASSFSQKILPADTVDSLQFEIKKQMHILSEINSLAYDDFQKCLADLNKLSRKCLDPNGKQLVFAVKKGTDNSILWKHTVRIACMKVAPDTRKIDCFKLLTLQQFLQVFRTFQTNLHAMVTVESHRINSPAAGSPLRSCVTGSGKGTPSNSSSLEDSNEPLPQSVAALDPSRNGNQNPAPTMAPLTFVLPECTTASMLMAQVDAITAAHSRYGSTNELLQQVEINDHNECCICLERKPEVSLPCAHSYCMPCIEQWNIHQKTCPICDEALSSTNDTWILSEMPEATEVSEEICATLLKLSTETAGDDESDKNWLRRMLDL